MKTFRLFIALLLGLICAATLSACSIGATNNAPAPHKTAVAVAKPTPSPVADPLVKAFGGTVTYQDGVAVTVTGPTPYQPSAEAAGGIAGQQVVKFTVTVINGSKDTIQIGGWPQATSGGQQASAVSDFGQNVGDTPNAPLLAGQQLSWDEAFSVADPTQITFSYSPTLDHKTAIFTNPRE